VKGEYSIVPATDPIAEKVFAAIASVKRVPQDTVSADKSLVELGFDSLDTINLLFELEESFNISIPDEEARRVRNVSDVIAGVRQLIEPAAAGRTSGHAA
jgi:acyl carrier protein